MSQQSMNADAASPAASPDGTLDPVDYAVISQGLMAAAREMGVKLIRSSYSNIVREAQDASAALFDAEGNVVAQAELIPMQLGPMSDIFRACAAVVPPSSLKPGDFYINNDPLRWRPAPAGRLHLLADLRRRHTGRLRRHGLPPSRPRRRQPWPFADRRRRACGRHHPAAIGLERRPRLERRQSRKDAAGERACAGPDNRRLLRAIWPPTPLAAPACRPFATGMVPARSRGP